MKNKNPHCFSLFFLLPLTFFSTISFAASPAEDLASLKLATDTIWLVAAGALVFFMQAGFALLESGMVRAKNAVNVIMKNYVDMCFGGLVFWMVGYGLMFGTNPTGWFGTDHFFLSTGKDMEFTWLFFQTMFAAVSATIVSGAIAERSHFWAYIFGSMLITAFIYPVYGSWAWGSLYEGSGWLKKMGFIDFAGSGVVHTIGGWCALAALIVIKPRLGKYGRNDEVRSIPGHNLSSVSLGGFILWIGWFGFNGGSGLIAATNIGQIVLNTHLGGTAGAVGALFAMVITRNPILLTNTVNGSIAGLVAVTAGCATMSPMFAALTGFIAGILMMMSSSVMDKLRLDDVVGAVSVHAICGSWGVLAAGLFKHGDLFNIQIITVQAIGIMAAFLWAFPCSLIMYLIIDKTIGLRTSTSNEQKGLDYTEHYEIGYPEFQQNILHQGKE